LELKFLDKTEYGKWDEFVDSSANGTVFHKCWYIESLAQGYQFKLLVIKEDNKIIAGIPLCIKKRMNYSFILSPSLVSRQGIVFRKAAEEVSEYKKQTQLKEMSEMIAAELKKYSFFMQNFTAEYQDWQPFMWEGYRADVAYTYILDGLKDQERLQQNYSSKLRNTNKKAEKMEIKVVKDNNINAFIALYKQTFSRQGLENPVSEKLLRGLFERSFENYSGAIYFARDKEGNDHSAAFILFDKKRAYYLLSGSDPKYRSSGAGSLLLAEIIRLCSDCCDQFDFEGSNIPAIEKHFRSYGGKLTPYFRISKANAKLIGLYKKFCS